MEKVKITSKYYHEYVSDLSLFIELRNTIYALQIKAIKSEKGHNRKENEICKIFCMTYFRIQGSGTCSGGLLTDECNKACCRKT